MEVSRHSACLASIPPTLAAVETRLPQSAGTKFVAVLAQFGTHGRLGREFRNAFDSALGSTTTMLAVDAKQFQAGP